MEVEHQAEEVTVFDILIATVGTAPKREAFVSIHFEPDPVILSMFSLRY
jgi:hypothetical protein